ncbi:hypothetical protein QQ045_002056 [Rhodiola kirilowii]
MRNTRGHKDCTCTKTDIKKLKKLILESKLAPCYPGDEDYSCDLEECPICFLSYPSLNRSRCCSKSICTECFLQLKMPNATRPTQCPFCKTANYAVEYRGTKTKKEKSIEQIEEQRVIEAKIRMRQQEMQEEEVKLQQRQETSSSHVRVTSIERNHTEATANGILKHYLRGLTSPNTNIYENIFRDNELVVDLEDIMVMEAIWLSMQENNMSTSGDFITSERPLRQDIPYISSTTSASSSAGGLASAIATLVEHQQIDRDSPTSYDNNALPLTTYSSHRTFDGRQNQHVDRYYETGRATRRAQDSSELSFASSAEQESEGGFRSISGRLIPESFEEQMTLAMTMSLGEARAIASSHGL